MNKIYKIPKVLIFIFLIALIVVSWWIAYCSSMSESIKSLFGNLISEEIAILITLFGIDLLIQQSNKMKWKDAEEIAKLDSALLANQLTSHIASPLGFSAMDYKLDPDDVESNYHIIRENIISDILARDMEKIITSMSCKQWNTMLINILIIRQSFSDNINIYSKVWPPEILGKLLQVGGCFRKFDNLFGLVPELFTKNESEWPENKGGIKNNRAIRTSLLKSFSKDLQDYFKRLNELNNLINRWS